MDKKNTLYLSLTIFLTLILLLLNLNWTFTEIFVVSMVSILAYAYLVNLNHKSQINNFTNYKQSTRNIQDRFIFLNDTLFTRNGSIFIKKNINLI